MEAGDTRTDTGHLVAPRPQNHSHEAASTVNEGPRARARKIEASAFEAHVKACGLPVIRLHDSRHGACSLLLAGGVPIDVVQMILGHASPTVTRMVYAHVLRAATSAQVEDATKLLTSLRPEQVQGETA